MQQTIDKLKEKPKEQHTAVAGGIATVVVAVLLIGWAFFYLKKILSEQPAVDLPTEAYDLTSLRDAGGSQYNPDSSGAIEPFVESKNNP